MTNTSRLHSLLWGPNNGNSAHRYTQSYLDGTARTDVAGECFRVMPDARKLYEAEKVWNKYITYTTSRTIDARELSLSSAPALPVGLPIGLPAGLSFGRCLLLRAIRIVGLIALTPFNSLLVSCKLRECGSNEVLR